MVDSGIYTILKVNVYEITLYYGLPSINKDCLFILALYRRHIKSVKEILPNRDTYNHSSTKSKIGVLQIILD